MRATEWAWEETSVTGGSCGGIHTVHTRKKVQAGGWQTRYPAKGQPSTCLLLHACARASQALTAGHEMVTIKYYSNSGYEQIFLLALPKTVSSRGSYPPTPVRRSLTMAWTSERA